MLRFCYKIHPRFRTLNGHPKAFDEYCSLTSSIFSENSQLDDTFYYIIYFITFYYIIYFIYIIYYFPFVLFVKTLLQNQNCECSLWQFQLLFSFSWCLPHLFLSGAMGPTQNTSNIKPWLVSSLDHATTFPILADVNHRWRHGSGECRCVSGCTGAASSWIYVTIPPRKHYRVVFSRRWQVSER